jgi:hypothetical protein
MVDYLFIIVLGRIEAPVQLHMNELHLFDIYVIHMCRITYVLCMCMSVMYVNVYYLHLCRIMYYVYVLHMCRIMYMCK